MSRKQEWIKMSKFLSILSPVPLRDDDADSALIQPYPYSTILPRPKATKGTMGKERSQVLEDSSETLSSRLRSCWVCRFSASSLLSQCIADTSPPVDRCAHQVCNFSDCIKVASDFVSIENVGRCWKGEFRVPSALLLVKLTIPNALQSPMNSVNKRRKTNFGKAIF
jgi:hypothetical protein